MPRITRYDDVTVRRRPAAAQGQPRPAAPVGAGARPAHGYAVIAALRDRSEGTFDLPEGTVYPALHRLERAGCSLPMAARRGRRRWSATQGLCPHHCRRGGIVGRAQPLAAVHRSMGAAARTADRGRSRATALTGWSAIARPAGRPVTDHADTSDEGTQPEGSDAIESYLDDLADRLRLQGRHLRHVLAEVDDHLAAARAAALAEGLDDDAAARRAVAEFGPADLVARRLSRSGNALTSQLVRQGVQSLLLVAAIGLLAVGLSGLLAWGAGAAFGKPFVSGDATGVTYTAARCAEYQAIAPSEPTCAKAAVATTSTRSSATARMPASLGLIVLAAWLGLVRPWRRRARDRDDVRRLACRFCRDSRSGTVRRCRGDDPAGWADGARVRRHATTERELCSAPVSSRLSPSPASRCPCGDRCRRPQAVPTAATCPRPRLISHG